jgi:shikimate dehydrogenase
MGSRGGPASPSAQTQVVAVIGDPVEHSLSPTIHNAAFRALGMDWVYVALAVPAEHGFAAVAAMRVLGLAGLSVTMPHKQAAAAAVDRLTPTALALGAVNTVSRAGDELMGDSTDGPGLVEALRDDEGFDPAGRQCVVIGAGGAARAAVRALADAGAARIAVVNRTRSRAEAAVALAPDVAVLGTADEVGDAALVVNATPLGMGGDEGLPLDPSRLAPGQLVVDMVYHPAVTPLLEAARQAGAAAVNGLGMLIHQAAHQFRIWTGEEAPLEAMSVAAVAELARRHG